MPRKVVRDTNSGSKVTLKQALRNSTKTTSSNEPDKSPQPESIPAESTEPKVDSPDDERRISFVTDQSVNEIRWNRFKSSKGVEAVQRLIANEAEKLGYRKIVEESGDDLITFPALCGIYNMAVISTTVALTHCPQRVAEILAFTEQEQDAINAGGAADRLTQKYIGSLAFRWKDELIVGMALIPVMMAKASLFKKVMKEWQTRKQNEVTTVTTPKSGEEKAA